MLKKFTQEHIIINGMVAAIMYGPALFYILIFTNKYQSFKNHNATLLQLTKRV